MQNSLLVFTKGVSCNKILVASFRPNEQLISVKRSIPLSVLKIRFCAEVEYGVV